MIPYNSILLTQEQMQEIIRLYRERKANGVYWKQSELADCFNVSASTVSKVLRAAGIDCSRRLGISRRKLTEEDIEEIIRFYTTPAEDGTWLGGETIGKMFDVTGPTIRRQLENHGIEIRSFKEAHAHGKACRPRTHGGLLPPEEETPPSCKCGCGKQVEWDQRHYRWYKYVKGHYAPPANENGSTSSLEDDVAEVLDDMGLKYERQKPLHDPDTGQYFAWVDFWLEGDIVLEVNGSFWHVDPRLYPDGPECEWQEKTLENDKRRKTRMKELGIPIIEVWGLDIKENMDTVRDTIANRRLEILTAEDP